MNAAFLLITTAWLAGADGCCGRHISDLDRDSYWPPRDALRGGFEFGLLEIKLIHFGRGEHQLAGRLGKFGVFQCIGHVRELGFEQRGVEAGAQVARLG